MAGIPEEELVGIHAELDGGTAGIIFVGDRIEDRFPQGLLGDWIGLHPLNPIIGNQRLEVFCAKSIEGFVCLAEEIAVNLIVENEIGIRAEVSDFDIGTGDESLGVGMEEEHCSAFQIMAIHQVQLLQKLGIRLLQDFRREPLAAVGAFSERGQRTRIEIGRADIRHRHAIPMPSLLAQKKPVQRRSLQLLFCAPAPVMVFPLVADRIRIRLDDNLDKVGPLLVAKIHVHQNPEHIPDLVRDVFQQLRRPAYPDRNPLVVLPDDKDAAARVRKAADPLQVFVPPGFFPLDGLVLGH